MFSCGSQPSPQLSSGGHVIRSMTGFGRGQATESGYTITVEVRSVNGRYAETTVRLPRAMADLESSAVGTVQKRVSRGKVTVAVSLESGNGQATSTGVAVVPDLRLAQSYRDALEKLRDELGLSGQVDLHAITRFTDVFVTKEAQFDAESMACLLDRSLAMALDALDAMRLREGEALAADFLGRIGLLSGLLATVMERAPLRIEEARQKLRDRIAALLDNDVVDEARLAMEIAIIADRSDITEECTRLRSHLEQFKDLMREETAGRKLNFLLQEMNREVNTIGSKSNDAAIAHMVVEMKDEIERLREQVQNVE